MSIKSIISNKPDKTTAKPKRKYVPILDKIDTNDLKKESILKSLANGNSVTQACEESDVSRPNFYCWVTADPDFALAVRAAKKSRIHSLEDVLHKTALGGNLGALIFSLTNLDPEHWKNTQHTESRNYDTKFLVVCDPKTVEQMKLENAKPIKDENA